MLSGALDRRLFIVAVLTLGVMARAATYRSPLFDFHAWRQADTASIARNFVEERFNPAYPQVDFRGGRAEGYVETGFELYAFIVAAIAKVVGFSPELGRLLNVVLFPLAALLLSRFVRIRYGESASMVALFLYSLGLPLTMFMDRAFMNESLLALLAIVCLVSAQAYLLRLRPRDLAVMVAACALIAMMKPTYLVVTAVVVGLFIERFGKAALLRPELWVAGVLTVGFGALWFWHAQRLNEMTGLSFGLENKLLSREGLTWSDYPFILARRIVKDLLGPVGVLFAPVGLLAAVRAKKQAELWGVLAFAVYLVVVAAGNFHHNYYQLPIVPIAAVLAGAGVVTALRHFSERYQWSQNRTIAVCAGILWVAAVSTFARNVSAHNWYEIDERRVRLCEDLKPLLSGNDRVIFVNDPSPDMLFCLDRKGWLLNGAQSTLANIRQFASEGGSVAVIRKSDPLLAGLQQSGERMMETPDFIAYRLAPPPPLSGREGSGED